MKLCLSKIPISMTNAYPYIISSFKTNDFISTQDMKSWVPFSFPGTSFSLSSSPPTPPPVPTPHRIFSSFSSPFKSQAHFSPSQKQWQPGLFCCVFLKLRSELPKSHLRLHWTVNIMKSRLYLSYSSMLNHKYISLCSYLFIYHN